MVRKTEEEADGSNSKRMPKGAKYVPAGDQTCYSVAHLGEKLYQQSPEFDLTDPNMHLVDHTYNCLHDAHLRQYFQKPERKRRLIRNGFITADEKVLCTKKDYNKYARYTKSVQLSWEKVYYEHQRKLMKDFLIRKEKGLIPPHIHISDMREWLVHNGTVIHKYMFQRQSGNTGAMHLSQLEWEVNRRLKLETIEKEVCRELRVERKKLPLSERTEIMKKSVECIPYPGPSKAASRCLSSAMSGTSSDLVFTSSTSIEIFSTPDSRVSSDDTEHHIRQSSDLLSNKSEEGRFTALLPDKERVIYKTIKQQVTTELRKNFFPALRKNTEKNEWSLSRRFCPTRACSQQSHRSSSPPSSGPSSSTKMAVHTKPWASIHSDVAISPSTRDNTMKSYLGVTFYTEVPISERLCDENNSFPPACLIVSGDTTPSTVDNVALGTEELHASNSTSTEEDDNRCVSVRPLTITHKKGVRLLGGMTTDTDDSNIVDEDLDFEVEHYTQHIIKAVAQQLSERSVNNMDCDNTTRGPSTKQHSEKLVNSVAAVLYHNICETEASRKRTPYSGTQVTVTDSWCEITENHALNEFAEPLSQSAVDLLKGTFGTQAAQSLKTKKSDFELITKPTSERLLFVSSANNKDTVVHKVAVEELSTVDVVEITSLKSKDNTKRVKTPSSRPNTSASARHSRPQTPTKHVLQAVVEKLVAKMAVHCMNIPEESNETACKQLEETCHSPKGPLSEFHYRVASRLCPVLVSDIMESLSSEIVSPHDGESATQSPAPFAEDDLVKSGKSGAVSPHHHLNEYTPFKDGSNGDVEELPSDSAEILQMAVSDIESALTDSGKQTCSSLPPKTEVVVDIITKLMSDIESGTESPNSPLTNVAVDMVVSVLDNLSEVSSAASPDRLDLEYTRPATAKIVGTVRKELEEQVGSTDALKQALNSGSEDVKNAISNAVSREVSVLLSGAAARHLASTSSSDSLSSSLDTTSSPTVRPQTAAVRPKFNPDCGLNPNHRSSSAMDRKPVATMVHFETLKDIVSRLLVQLLPKGLNDFNLAGCSLFDIIFEELSTNLFVRVTGKKQKATVCLDSVEVTQVVLSIYTELIKLYGSPEHVQRKVFANCPQLYGKISKLIVKSILRSPTRKPTTVEAKPSYDGPSQGTSRIPTSNWSLSVDSIEDILGLLFRKMQKSFLDAPKDCQLSQVVLSYLTINIMDMTVGSLKTIPGLVLEDKEENISDILKDKMASNIYRVLRGKGITVESLRSAEQEGSSSALCIIRDELIKEIRTMCFLDDCPDVVKPQQENMTTVSCITQDKVEFDNRSSSAASSRVDDSLKSAIDKEKTPKRKSRAGRIILSIFKGVRGSFTSCFTSGRVKD